MAVSNLRCTREGDILAAIWTWDMEQENAQITVTRLLDGQEVAYKEVDQVLYEQAINSPRHGPTLRVPPVPLRVKVKDGSSEESIDLIDKHYTVEWRLKRKNVYQRKGIFGQKLIRTDFYLQMLFPYEEQVPNDLLCYVLSTPGGKPQKGDPVGYLPELRPGRNEYGVIVPGGRSIHLCCNSKSREISRLFDFKRLPDAEE